MTLPPPTSPTRPVPTIAVLGTLDTKGIEHSFLAEAIRSNGFLTLLINVGSLEAPAIPPDIATATVAAASAENWQAIFARKDRGECVALMARASAAFLTKLVESDSIHGVISLGGGGGTAIATAAMRALPLGFPKVMVSTLASGNTAPYVGTKDITMIPAIVDVSGINRISRAIFENAAGAISGMVAAAQARRTRPSADKPLLVASMFGNTTACVDYAKSVLERSGYEVLVFHSTGTGGRAMESLISSGLVSGVLDITTTEWADELTGGVLSAGPERLDAAAKAGIPTIVVPGCLDMANFGEPHTLPEKYAARTLYHHNPQVTLLRTNPEECRALGEILASKVNTYRGPVSVLLPLQALSVISQKGQPFYDPTADAALFNGIRDTLRKDIPLHEIDSTINAPSFAEACANELLRLIDASR